MQNTRSFPSNNGKTDLRTSSGNSLSIPIQELKGNGISSTPPGCRLLATKNKRCTETCLSPIKVSKKILCSKYSYIQFFIFTVIYSVIAER
jgi:hypothetical protein